MNNEFLNFLKKKNLTYHFVVAFVLILFWLILARNYYQYNHNFWAVYNVSIFTLASASIGLFVLYIIYSWIKFKFNLQGFLINFLVFLGISWVILIFLETVGYHIFNIHNLKTAQYPGLPFCDCIHAPHWMQIVYFLMAPVYFLICKILKLEK